MANVLITGSNSGFGRLTAETLAKAGHMVFATMRESTGKNLESAAELNAFGAANGGRIRVVDLDVTSDASVQEAIDAIAGQCGGVIDVVFNNAGRFSAGVQEAYTASEVRSLFETNVFGVLRVNRAALPYMRKRGSGLVIATSSLVGRFALPCIGPYCASKFALEALAEAQRDELKVLGIDVVLIQAGAFPTKLGSKGLYAADAARAAQYAAVAGAAQKMSEGLAQLFSGPNAPNPQDVADAVKKLVEAPAGTRPARVVVDNLTGDALRALNGIHRVKRQVVMASLGMA